jgi:phytoene/squalene synthetase
MDPAPLYHLIAANRADQTTSEYPTFADLLGYCRLSANPIGRLVLGAFGFTDDQRMAWSDSICSGLQLAEHWQDVAEDGRAGRVYLPVEDLTRFGLSAADVFDRRPGAGASPLFKALMVFEVARARQLLEDGAPLINSLPGRCRWAVAGFYAGGHAALDAIAAQDFDVLAVVARPRPLRVAVRMVSVLGGSRL